MSKFKVGDRAVCYQYEKISYLYKTFEDLPEDMRFQFMSGYLGNDSRYEKRIVGTVTDVGKKLNKYDGDRMVIHDKKANIWYNVYCNHSRKLKPKDKKND